MTNTAFSPILDIRNATANYGRVVVVHGVSLSVDRSDVLVVLGANGAGKSSLLGSIAGTVQGKGTIQVGNVSVGGVAAHQRARHGLSFVPEARRNLFPSLSVAENLALGLRLIDKGERGEVLSSILKLFPILNKRQTAAAGMLSGGEQQMLAIGVALGRKPQALLLDEPTQGLAPAIFDILHDAIEQLRQTGMAILVAEQNLDFASRVAHRHVVMSHGQIVKHGGALGEDEAAAIAAAYFGEPQSALQ